MSGYTQNDLEQVAPLIDTNFHLFCDIEKADYV